MLWFIFNLFLLLPTMSAQFPPYNATDLILLDCGATSESTNANNRVWNSDAGSRYLQTTNSDASLIFPASTQISSVVQAPYMAARVFQSPFTYRFPLHTGPKFLRLYFYPNNYSTFNTEQSFFSVTANGYTLLTNFSAFLNSPSASNPSFFREYAINIGSDQRLDLTFTPNSNSFAFVNGIEIVSMPNTLYFRGNGIGIQSVTSNGLENLRNDTALQILYRLNVGGGTVGNEADSGSNGMFRTWLQDDEYLNSVSSSYAPSINFQINYTTTTPSYTAPDQVYITMRTLANFSRSIDWTFPVDSGYNYLLRLHFCEFLLEVTQQNQRIFSILINNRPAVQDADVLYWSGSPNIPIFRDYMVFVADDGRNGRSNINISLVPFLQFNPEYHSAMLNGLEIFKMNSTAGSLAGANPDPVTTTNVGGPGAGGNSSSSPPPVLYAVISSVVGVVALIAIITFVIFRRHCKANKDIEHSKTTKSSWAPLHSDSRSTTTNRSGVTLPSDLCRRFLLEEMKAATGDFDENFVIGKGGFGNVYKGYIDDGTTPVAIKRLKTSSNQGVREFVTEIDMLSKLRHVNLVSLLGYCNEHGEMILVYEFMMHGTLREHLYNSANSPLSWKKRLKICIGSAKGLHYLHTSAKHTLIHRDVKSTNILLNEKWVAKVSDFGLSRVGPMGGTETHVSTVVKGSFGYVDPEYYRRQQLTDKSDVFSFGVVLLEVLCARPAIIPGISKEKLHLAEWAKDNHRRGTIGDIVDVNLKSEIASECLGKFVETALSCLKERGSERPAMSNVVRSLEFAMQLQDAAEKMGGEEKDVMGSFIPTKLDCMLTMNTDSVVTDNEQMFSGTSDSMYRSKSSGFDTSSDNLKPENVISDTMNPTVC